MEITYQLGDAGWADARVRDANCSRDISSVSYLSDALGDMAVAAVALVQGARSVRFAFEHEPGEHRWLLERGEDDLLGISLLWFDDNFPARQDDAGEEVFSCQCRVLDFAGQVLSILASILEQYGVSGYREKWQRHEFPLEAFQTLRASLTVPIHKRA